MLKVRLLGLNLAFQRLSMKCHRIRKMIPNMRKEKWTEGLMLWLEGLLLMKKTTLIAESLRKAEGMNQEKWFMTQAGWHRISWSDRKALRIITFRKLLRNHWLEKLLILECHKFLINSQICRKDPLSMPTWWWQLRKNPSRSWWLGLMKLPK